MGKYPAIEKRGTVLGRALRLLVTMALVLAACGGSDEPAASTAAPGDDGGSTTSTTAAATTTTEAAPLANPSDDFCEFIIAYDEETDFSPIGMNAAELEEAFTNNLDAINQAAELAPSEIRGDVVMFAEAYAGFVELLAENGFNFLALANVDQNDPRLTALEDPDLQAAGDRIEAFCGIDDFIATPPQPPDDSGGGGGTALPGGELPEDFPTALIPDGATIVVVLNVQGTDTVTYDIEMSTDEVIGFYEELLGTATSELDDPKGAFWLTSYEGTNLTVTVAETGGTQTQVNLALG